MAFARSAELRLAPSNRHPLGVASLSSGAPLDAASQHISLY